MNARLILAALCAILLAGAPSRSLARPGNVVSLNLCADQLLIRLADPAQIKSLSPLARDPALSHLAIGANDFSLNDGKGESVLFGGGDLVLAGAFGQQGRTALLRRQGFDVHTLEPWRSLAHGREQIRRVASLLGQNARGEMLIAEIDAALARAVGAAPPGKSILTYYRRGFVPAQDSLVSEILRHMGFVPHQRVLGLTRGGVSQLETLVMAPPDYLLLDEEAGRAIDHGSALLIHPALTAAVPVDKRLSVAGRLSICGGPSTPSLIDALADQARRLR